MKSLIPATALCSILLLAPSSSSHALTTDKAVKAMGKGDFELALKELRPLIEKNDPNAQFLMGMLYDAGKGVPQDQAIAASWYRKAAEQNHLMAQTFLGVFYYSGTGVEKDCKKAAHWLKAPANTASTRPSSTWERCMRKETASVKTIPKRSSGLQRHPPKRTPAPWACWPLSCFPGIKASRI